MRKFKVLHIITRLDAGGSATNTLETVARLDKEKYQIFLVVGKTDDPDGQIARFIKDKNIECVFIDVLCREIHPLNDFKAFLKLFKIVKQGDFDIVHTHSSKAGILGRWASWLAGVKHIIHTPHGHVFYGYFSPFISKVFIIAEQITAKITDKIITLTDIGRDEHIRFKIAKLETFTTIYSGIDLKKFNLDLRVSAQYREIWAIQHDEVVFGTVARLDPIKGNKFIVEAMAQVIKESPNAKLVFVGGGSQRKALEEQSIKLNLGKHIIFTDYQVDVKNYIGMFDIFVLASLNEGMGRVILEAMVCSKPVIASCVGGIPELVNEGKNGLLFSAGDSDALAKVMIQLANDNKKMEDFGKEGKKYATEKFSLDKMIKDIDDLYQELII